MSKYYPTTQEETINGNQYSVSFPMPGEHDQSIIIFKNGERHARFDTYQEAHEYMAKVRYPETSLSEPTACEICGHPPDHPTPCPIQVNRFGDPCGCTHQDFPVEVGHGKSSKLRGNFTVIDDI